MRKSCGNPPFLSTPSFFKIKKIIAVVACKIKAELSRSLQREISCGLKTEKRVIMRRSVQFHPAEEASPPWRFSQGFLFVFASSLFVSLRRGLEFAFRLSRPGKLIKKSFLSPPPFPFFLVECFLSVANNLLSVVEYRMFNWRR